VCAVGGVLDFRLNLLVVIFVRSQIALGNGPTLSRQAPPIPEIHEDIPEHRKQGETSKRFPVGQTAIIRSLLPAEQPPGPLSHGGRKIYESGGKLFGRIEKKKKVFLVTSAPFSRKRLRLGPPSPKQKKKDSCSRRIPSCVIETQVWRFTELAPGPPRNKDCKPQFLEGDGWRGFYVGFFGQISSRRRLACASPNKSVAKKKRGQQANQMARNFLAPYLVREKREISPDTAPSQFPHTKSGMYL